ncbi:MAG: amidohydrolase family protein [Acidimicrobiia bacterium]|nr:amidohydrolase family protein [Acidimicrobiia bacterium]
MSSPDVNRCDLLLVGGAVVTVDDARNVFDPGAVAVTGDRVTAVGPAEQFATWEADRVIDTTGMAVLPGFSDTHQHLFQYLMRGLGEGIELWPWLEGFIWPLSDVIRPADAIIGAKLAAIEAAHSGVTAILDNHYAPTDIEATLGVAASIEGVGLRGAVARGMMGDPTDIARRHNLAGEIFAYTAAEELAITRECIEERPPGTQVGVWPAPVNIIYCDQDLMRSAVALAHEFGTGWHTHCSEAENDPVYYLEEYGVRPVDWLYEEGLLGTGATLAHGIFFDDREVERVGETETGIAYCPISHEYIGLGVMRLRDLRNAGAKVGLGLDGGSGHRLDMFACMKQAVLLQRVHHKEPTASNGEEVIELATREGARYLGTEAGYLAPGRLADMAVVRLSGAHHTPLLRVVAALVYAGSPADVAYTIVGGRVILEDGKCTQVDEEAVFEEAAAHANELVAAAGFEGLLEPWRTDLAPSQ